PRVTASWLRHRSFLAFLSIHGAGASRRLPRFIARPASPDVDVPRGIFARAFSRSRSTVASRRSRSRFSFSRIVEAPCPLPPRNHSLREAGRAPESTASPAAGTTTAVQYGPMAGRVVGGFNQYGFTIGILMLDTRFPRIVGDMGNAATFDFPVRYHRVSGADPDLVVRRGASGLLPAFVAGARALEREGVR